MYRFYLAAIDMLLGALHLIPLYWILNRIYFNNTRKSILYCLFSCYIATVYVLVGLPNVTYIRPELNLNLVPLTGMIDDWKNSILNILLFIPLGTSVPLLWRRFRTAKATVLFGFIISLVIELLQTLTYRTTDVNDLITNTIGTFGGYLCAQFLLQRFPMLRCIVKEDNTSDLVIIFPTVLLLMFFAYPFVSATLWDFILS